jgi:hypothetical protein
MRREKASDEHFDAIVEKELSTLNRRARRLLKYKREHMKFAIVRGNVPAYLQTSSGSVQYGKSNIGNTGSTPSTK